MDYWDHGIVLEVTSVQSKSSYRGDYPELFGGVEPSIHDVSQLLYLGTIESHLLRVTHSLLLRRHKRKQDKYLGSVMCI